MNCILCEKNKTKKLRKPLVICKNCGLVYIKKPKKISRPYGLPKSSRRFAYSQNNKISKEVYDWITQYKKKGSILEIGCWDGYILEEFRKNGWKVNGIEPSARPVPSQKMPFNYIKCGSFPKTSFKKKFDVILMRHTLEHTINPLKVLKACKKILKKDGILAIITPDITNPQGKFYNMFHDNRLFFFSHTTLRKLLHKSGFQNRHISWYNKIKSISKHEKKIWFDFWTFHDQLIGKYEQDPEEIISIVKNYKYYYWLKGIFIKRFIIHTIGKIRK